MLAGKRERHRPFTDCRHRRGDLSPSSMYAMKQGEAVRLIRGAHFEIFSDIRVRQRCRI